MTDLRTCFLAQVGQRTLLKDSVGVDNWGKYIREMSQHGVTWGDEATLLGYQTWALANPRLAPLLSVLSPPLLSPLATRLLSSHVFGSSIPRWEAASVLFRAEICVISSLSEDYCHIVTPPDIWQIELRTRIYLGHFAEYHYVSTRPV